MHCRYKNIECVKLFLRTRWLRWPPATFLEFWDKLSDIGTFVGHRDIFVGHRDIFGQRDILGPKKVAINKHAQKEFWEFAPAQ